MENVTSKPEQPMDSRRRFIKGATTSAIGAQLALQPQFVHASGDETLKVGLIGCGRRGRGAVVNALMADPQTRLVSLGDVFADQIVGDATLSVTVNASHQIEVKISTVEVNITGVEVVVEEVEEVEEEVEG